MAKKMGKPGWVRMPGLPTKGLRLIWPFITSPQMEVQEIGLWKSAVSPDPGASFSQPRGSLSRVLSSLYCNIEAIIPPRGQSFL